MYRRAIGRDALAASEDSRRFERDLVARPRPAVAVSGLSKTFRLPHERRSTVKERLVDRFRRRPAAILPALHDVTFEVRRGECLGIVGPNGSGKSTLLKCIAGIYDIDAGTVEVDGRLSPFVDLGVGVDGQLTGRDNVLLSAVLLGLSRRQARQRFDEIVSFAELGEFIDLELKNYSAGMGVRLSFSVSIQVDADVLLIDEVLAVGDAAFRAKCLDEFEHLRRQGRTILFVTHDMDSLTRFCDRALLLDRGRVVAEGGAAAIAERYDEINRGGSRLPRRIEAAPARELPRAPRSRSRDRRRRRYRPSAFGGDARRLAGVAWALAAVDFKLHYLGSALGYLWSVMRPLMLFAVVYAVFTRVGSFGEGVEHYGVYLLTSIVLWTYFAESTSGGATSLIRHQALIRRLRFPRLAVPLAVVLRATFNLGLNLVAVAVLVALSGISPRPSWLELPLLVVLLAVLATAIAILLSAISVRLRDVPQIWTVALQLLFFGSAVLYVVTEFSDGLQRAMVVNPLAMIFTEMRHALIDPTAPTAAAVAGGYPALLVPLAEIAAVAALGLWVFNRESARMAENL